LSEYVGVDFGGTSIKAALVDVSTGKLLSAINSVPTPVDAAPAPCLAAIQSLVSEWSAPVGVALPAVIRQGKTLTAANIDSAWLGFDAKAHLTQLLARPVVVLNDADAAGLAELHYGAANGRRGTVLMLTFGTGIGSALFVNGVLWPNTELGHLQLQDCSAEHLASGKARTRDGLSFAQWAQRVERVLAEYQKLLWPDVVIIGGGISEHFEQFASLLTTSVPIIPAKLRQDAGIVGAAWAAAQP
jgi:polyphosphate glucokinase